MASPAGYVVLGLGILAWLYMTFWVVHTARSRGSRLWPMHGLATLAFGIGYVLPYWLVTRNG